MTCVDSDFSMMRDESDFEDDAFDMSDNDENVAPPSKGSRPAPKRSGKQVLSANTNAGNVPASEKGIKKTVEQMYQKKTQLEHILLRPDTYIGSVEPLTDKMFVFDDKTERMVSREITYTPGLYKIFDEIVVNAADNKQRDPSMDKMDIMIDPQANKISVKNNGNGIPVVMHREHKCYVPTLIFGHLLTGSNFDDDEKKTTGGRNGYGAKLANIFSTEFTVECLDSNNGFKFTQTFRNNMTVTEDPIVKKVTSAEKKKGDYTKITFCPDLARFKMSELDTDTVALLSKRAYDIAGSMANRPGKKLAVTLNEKKLAIKTFEGYLKIFDGINPPSSYEKVSDRWEIGISSTDGTPTQISFVNSICTSKGGSHVAYIADQVAKHLEQTVKKKNKGGTQIKQSVIKNHLCVFVNCLVENPAFDSQTKDFLTTRHKLFGSKCELSPKFLKQLEKSDVVETVLSYAKFKQDRELKKKGGTKKKKLTGIPKLDDANFAGSAKSKDCTLIITEGDSAKSLAMSGLSVVGRDYYGVFPLRGKPLNVRDATHLQVMKNAEVKNVMEILGLKPGVTYDETNIKTLRYGHLMIMADQDMDGSHIKGLVINFIHTFWPSLLDVPGFLQQFITPIVKATKGKKSHTFFTLPQYEEWLESTENNGKGWKIKYYKGLGTSTNAEAKEYFSNLDLHEVKFVKLSQDIAQRPVQIDADPMDTEVFPDENISSSGSDLIDMVFRKARVEDRKNWLNNLKKDTYLDYSAAHAVGIKYSEFINKELILFSKSDNERSIPHVMDGFKPSQRKVLFACFKKKLKNEIKVAQLAGYVGEHSAYHHGEASLHGTIIGMAQTFCGSNNLNLLTPSGQFGTRRMGGKDAASPRYIFTNIEKITRTIFHPDDDELLTYLNDDGLSIEPEHFMPVIPLVLVNGSDGIGTGWSTSIPNYNPRDMIENLRHLIRGEELKEMLPWYQGFTGEILRENSSKFNVKGRIERIDDTTLVVSELPVRKWWTQDYKIFLEGMLTSETKGIAPDIIDFKENHTDTTVSFTITCDKKKIDGWENLPKGGLYAHFRLSTSMSTANMNLFDCEHRIVKYATPEDILKEFYVLRLEFYDRRKKVLVEKLQRERDMLSNKARFVEEVCSGDLVVSNRKKNELLSDLQQRGYQMFDKTTKTGSGDSEETDETEEDNSPISNLSKGYEYLLGMKIWSLTFEKAEELRSQLAERTSELERLLGTSPSQLWLNDLENIELALDERDAQILEAENDELKAQNKNRKRNAMKKQAAATKKGKKKAFEADSDMEDFDGDEDASGVDSFDVIVAKKTTATRRKPLPRAKAAAAKSKPVVAKKNAPGAAMAATAPLPEEEQDEVELSLAQRMKKKMMISPPPVKKAASRTDSLALHAALPTKPSFSDEDEGTSSSTSRSRKRPSPRADDSSNDDKCAILDFTETLKLPAKKTQAKPAKRARAVPPTKKKVPSKKQIAKTSGKKGPESNDYSDDEFDIESDSEPEVERRQTGRKAGLRARSARAVQKKSTYMFDDDSDEYASGSDSDF